MKVSEKDAAYIAALANLEFTGEAGEKMRRDLNSILGYMDSLNEVDTSSIEPMAQVARGQSRDGGRREDILDGLRKSLPHEVAMENAPETDGIYFKVPKVIER
jgi:aspartyl-tRNA(Asn)/glutamyl-tRNA(Gln) amidotransferase subunit C